MTTETYSGPERRMHVQLTDEQIEQIATKAATRAVEMMTSAAYEEVGKRTLRSLYYVIGVAALVLAGWLMSHDKIKW